MIGSIYDILLNKTMITGLQCQQYISENAKTDAWGFVLLFACMIVFAIGFCFYTIKASRFKEFIKEKHLEAEYKQFRDNNKDLDL